MCLLQRLYPCYFQFMWRQTKSCRFCFKSQVQEEIKGFGYGSIEGEGCVCKIEDI